METSKPKRGRPPKPKEVVANTTQEAGAEIVKAKRRTPASVETNTSAKAADVSRILANCLNWYHQPKVRSVEELRERTYNFFQNCLQRGEIPTWEKYCLSTGYYRQTIWDWVVGNSVSELGAEANDIVKKAKEYLATFESEMVTEGKINPVVYIFRAKNYFGMRDQQEYVLTPNTPLGEDADKNLLQSKYKTNIPEAILEDDEEN